MVSGFLISPYDQERICSGLAMLMRIWSKVATWPVWPRIFISSFMRSVPFESACAASRQGNEADILPLPLREGGGGRGWCQDRTETSRIDPSPQPPPSRGGGEVH